MDAPTAKTIIKMIQKCVELAKSQKDLQKLLFAIEQLKNCIKQMNIDLKTLSDLFGSLYSMFDKVIQKYVKLLVEQNVKKLDFYSETQSGSIFELLSQYNIESDSLTIKLSKPVYDEKQKKYLPLPSVTISGISKLNIETIKSIVFSIKVDENGVTIQLKLANENGEDIEPEEKINY